MIKSRIASLAMRVNIDAINRHYGDQITPTSFPHNGSNVGGWMVFHPNNEQWLSTTKGGVIIAFGEDQHKQTFDTNNATHRRKVNWVIKLSQKPQPKVSRIIRRGLPMTAQNRLKICEKLAECHRDQDPCLVNKTDDGKYQITLVNKELITVNQYGNVCRWYDPEFNKTVYGQPLDDTYSIAVDLRITDLRDRQTKKKRLTR